MFEGNLDTRPGYPAYRVQFARNSVQMPYDDFEVRRVTKEVSSPIVMQTSDDGQYAAMLDVTSRNVIAFCRKHDLGYRSFKGIKCGHWQWHACFNRLYMFDELIAAGHQDWVVYLDADAYVADMEFPIRQYLDEKKGHAGIVVHSNFKPEPWDVNNGVMFLNLATPVARAVVKEWIKRHSEIFNEPKYLSRERPYNFGDQRLLQHIFRDRPDWFAEFHVESQSLINSMHATFIKHHLRAITPDFDSRLVKIRQDLESI
jgi:hypothetical protein